MPDQDISGLKIDRSAFTMKSQKSRRWLWYSAAGGVVLLIVLGWLLIIHPSVTIETATVSSIYPTQSYTLLNASGYVVAQRKAALASKLTGRLEWIGVQEGDRVSRGQIVARLENRDAEAQKLQAEAQLIAAKAGVAQVKAEQHDAVLAFDRVKQLERAGIVSRSDYDTAKARRNKADAALSAAEASVSAARAAVSATAINVDYSLIRAPFDAVVLTKNADIGDIVTPIGAAATAKAAVFSIADMGSLQVEVDVSESSLGKVKAGQPCEIQLDAITDRRFRGVVQTVVPTADRTKAAVLVKVRFLDSDVRVLPEMSAKVAFLDREPSAEDLTPRLAIMKTALVKRDGKDVAFLLDGKKVVETAVTLGIVMGDQVEIVSGLVAGDKVAVKPLHRLKDGSRVSLSGE